MGSLPLSLSSADIKSIVKGAVIAGFGAAAAYGLSRVVPAIDQSTPLGITVAAVCAVVLNALRKYLSDTRE